MRMLISAAFVVFFAGCATSAPVTKAPLVVRAETAAAPAPPPAPAATATVDAPDIADSALYLAALERAEAAFTRDDAKGARAALEEAREIVATTFGARAPNVEAFRFIDGLATRFAHACDRIADRSDDAVAYADVVTPLHRAKTMRGRELPLPEEARMVLAAFRFARRAVYRELRAERGDAHDVRHARAIVDMAPVGYDVEMYRWVVAHVPEAAR